jgi:hypothetical protein
MHTESRELHVQPSERPVKTDKLIQSVLLQDPTCLDMAAGKRNLFRQFLDYHKEATNEVNATSEIDYLFRRFLSGNGVRRGLRLQFQPPRVNLFGKNWVTLDLASVEQGAREAGTASLDFESDYFDMVLCTGLDRISRPVSLIAEIRRVMKRRGQVWAQAPLNKANSSETGVASLTYWRFTPEGFQVLFENFDEILCSVYKSTGCLIRRDSFFYGIKPELPHQGTDENRAQPALSIRTL